MRQDEIGRERDKRILDPNSAHTQTQRENFEKKIAKKFKKLENNFSALYLAKSEMRQAVKEGNEFQTPIPLILSPGEKILKKKQQKNSKN